MIARVLNIPEIVFPRTFDLTTATMRDLRTSGKHIMIRSGWIDQAFCISWPCTGTWSSEFNFGPVSDGDRLYAHLRHILDEPNANRRLAMNRASGDSLHKELPRDYMNADKERFRALIEELMASPEKVAKINGLDFDFVTETHELAGAAILLNLVRETVNEEHREDFYTRITTTMFLP
jgi:hypothetical protein